MLGKQLVSYLEPHKPSAICLVWVLFVLLFLAVSLQGRVCEVLVTLAHTVQGKRRCWELRNEIQFWASIGCSSHKSIFL